ncbi:hypothetical protein F5Y01DRAFT_318980 [Xylaria sp. FL0043]|nr:hypothetical protein F5Y01DRAFT_318980 [Xylaria sp. FL0043]
MPSLPVTNTLWAIDLTSLSIGELTGYLIEARYIQGLLQSELQRRASKADYTRFVERLDYTETRLCQNTPLPEDNQRLEDLAKDRESIYTLQDISKQWNLEHTGFAFVWLIEQLTTSAHAALLYVAFSKTSLIRTTVNEKSAIIKMLYDRKNVILPSQLTASPMLPRIQDNESWVEDILSGKNPIGNILKILVLWGGINVPSCLLNNITCSSFIWGPDGEPLPTDPPPSILGNYASKQYILELSKRKVIDISIDSSLEESYTVPARIRQLVRSHGVSSSLRVFALMMVMHSFPKHQHLVPLHYSILAKKLLPIFQYMLRSVGDIWESLTVAQTVQTIEACLSASYFYGTAWKHEILSKIQLILSPLTYLYGKLMLRELVLSRIVDRLPADTDDRLALLTKLIGTDKRSNAYTGEVMMFRALLRQDKQDFAGAFDILSSYKAQDEGAVSTFEQIQLDEIYLRSCKLLRYQGRFSESESRFVEFLSKPGNKLLGRIDSHLAAVQCELGRPDKAIQTLEYELEVRNLRDASNGRNPIRINIALGEAHVMAGLRWGAVQHFYSASQIFASVSEALHKTSLARVGKIYLLRITVATSMISHVQGDDAEAYKGWNKVQEASRDCGWKEGHSDLVAKLSLSEIAYRSGDNFQGDTLLQDAIRIYKRTGQQYYFTGHGTLWPNIILVTCETQLHD